MASAYPFYHSKKIEHEIEHRIRLLDRVIRVQPPVDVSCQRRSDAVKMTLLPQSLLNPRDHTRKISQSKYNLLLRDLYYLYLELELEQLFEHESHIIEDNL